MIKAFFLAPELRKNPRSERQEKVVNDLSTACKADVIQRTFLCKPRDIVHLCVLILQET